MFNIWKITNLGIKLLMDYILEYYIWNIRVQPQAWLGCFSPIYLDLKHSKQEFARNWQNTHETDEKQYKQLKCQMEDKQKKDIQRMTEYTNMQMLAVYGKVN